MVFCMRSKLTKQYVIYPVEKRDCQTLWNIVKKHINTVDIPANKERALKKEREWYRLHTYGCKAYLSFDFPTIKRYMNRTFMGMLGHYNEIFGTLIFLKVYGVSLKQNSRGPTSRFLAETIGLICP